MVGEQVEIKGLLILPLVLTGIGVSDLHDIHGADAATVAFIAVSVALSVALGLVRGRTVHLGARDGVLWMRYRLSSVGLWVLNLVLKVALLPVEHAVSPAASSAANHALLMSIGLGILAETAVVLLRALSTDAAVAWSKGADGAPNTTSPAFEKARAIVADTGSLADAKQRLRDGNRGW
jgi:hypothetical protein